MKLGVFTWFSYPLPFEEGLRYIRQAGFDSVMLWWDKAEDQPAMVRKHGLDIANIHVPFPEPNRIWYDGPGGEAYLKLLLSGIDACRRHEIPTAVIHVSDFLTMPELTGIALERFKRLVDSAEQNGVNLALENLKFPEPLAFLFENIKSDRLGCCYDSGHEHCFTQEYGFLEKYGDKLFTVHIDDNFGNDDTHLLPFDGSVDWTKTARSLRRCRALDHLTLEVDFNINHPDSGIYSGLSPLEFLESAYNRLVKVSELIMSSGEG
jgi:sugar phosphate isomerase/epimerase